MVRKDGYFSITDACIKHCGANFLIVRPKKKFLRSLSARAGEARRSAGDTGGRRRTAPPPAGLLPAPAAGSHPALSAGTALVPTEGCHGGE